MVDRKWAKQERERIAKAGTMGLIAGLREAAFHRGEYCDSLDWDNIEDVAFTEDEIAKELRRRLKGGKR